MAELFPAQSEVSAAHDTTALSIDPTNQAFHTSEALSCQTEAGGVSAPLRRGRANCLTSSIVSSFSECTVSRIKRRAS